MRDCRREVSSIIFWPERPLRGAKPNQDLVGRYTASSGSGTLNIGPSGSGVLDIVDGGAVNAGGGTTVGPNGTIMGDGTITTQALINNDSVMPIGPTRGPATLTDNGNYQQGSTGTLDIGIGGKQAS